MLAKWVRFAGLAVLGALGVWWGRQIAHSKKPPPEGRWHELEESEL